MGQNQKPPSLDKLATRLRSAREHRKAGRRPGETDSGAPGGMSGVGTALRIGVELVSALIVGVGIGLVLDWWLDTRPLFLVVFFLLGAGAGFVNVYRATAGYGLAVGYRKEDGGDRSEKPAAGERSAGENGENGES